MVQENTTERATARSTVSLPILEAVDAYVLMQHWTQSELASSCTGGVWQRQMGSTLTSEWLEVKAQYCCLNNESIDRCPDKAQCCNRLAYATFQFSHTVPQHIL